MMVKFNESAVFVFGSNLEGVHGAGAALHAKKHYGAIQGVGKGIQGNSYAIPTKVYPTMNATLPLSVIQSYVDVFILYAEANPELTFEVTAIGCGLAGYDPEDIAPLFISAPDNCILPEVFHTVFGKS